MNDGVDRAADRLERARHGGLLFDVRPFLQIDRADFVDEALISRRQPDHLGFAAARLEHAQQTLQQPGAVGVEFFDARHVDDDAARAVLRAGMRFDQLLKGSRLNRRPRTGTRQR
jgi:hypothetical protein